MGHGKVRTCMTCILSWAAGEMIAIDFAEGEASKTTDLPPALKKRISELEQDLKSATDITRRLKQLISIADDDWDRAENAS